MRKIWVSARELSLTSEELHSLLMEVVGKASIRALTKDEAKLLIDVLVDRGASGQGRQFTAPWKAPSRAEGPLPPRAPGTPAPPAVPPARPSGGNVITLATHRQLAMLDHLLQQVGLAWDSPRFLGILGKAIGRSRVRTTADARAVIEALKAIARRQDARIEEGSGGRQ